MPLESIVSSMVLPKASYLYFVIRPMASVVDSNSTSKPGLSGVPTTDDGSLPRHAPSHALSLRFAQGAGPRTSLSFKRGWKSVALVGAPLPR